MLELTIQLGTSGTVNTDEREPYRGLNQADTSNRQCMRTSPFLHGRVLERYCYTFQQPGLRSSMPDLLCFLRCCKFLANMEYLDRCWPDSSGILGICRRWSPASLHPDHMLDKSQDHKWDSVPWTWSGKRIQPYIYRPL